MKRMLFSFAAVLAFSAQAFALSIGYFDNTRELYGFSSGTPYVGNAKQWLVDQGHTLVSTNTADAGFFSGVDAFYVGLTGSVTVPELAAMAAFVEQGGFLFIQADHGLPWATAASSLLATFGLAHDETPRGNGGADYTIVSNSDWVGPPGVDVGFIGDAHTRISTAPNDFEVLATGLQGETVLGVLYPTGSRLGAVVVATDINFWNNTHGWTDARNRSLWASIWNTAAGKPNPPGVPDNTSTAALLALSVLGLAALQRRRRVAQAV
jgi:hypothetical protein